MAVSLDAGLTPKAESYCTYPLNVTVDAGSVSVIKTVLSWIWVTVNGSSVCVSRIVLSIVSVTGLGVM